MRRGGIFVQAPLLPVAASLATGIALGVHIPGGGLWVAALAALVALSVLLWRWPLAQSLGILLSCMVLGVVVAPKPGQHLPDGVWAEATVALVPAERPKTLMTELLLPATGERRRCYFWKDERSRQLQLGDDVVVRLHDSIFVGRHDWQPGGQASSRLSRLQLLRIRALRWRAALLGRLQQEGADQEAEAVLAAMTLGDKTALTPQLRDTYSRTGASHVLALSGLHLGIIYMLLWRLTLGRRRHALSQVLVVLAVWAFALVTGLSASVVRAAIMISIYSIFDLGGRRGSPLGVLSFTAIVMLLVDSHALFDIGFQLSFMAMLGILLVLPAFGGLATPRWRASHRLVSAVGSLMAVSVAAQLGTAPLVAYHFGRFSTYFLLTNLVVVPAATLIIYGALAALLMPALAGWLLALVGLLNAVLGRLSALPGASIEGLHPTALQVAALYVLEAVVVAALALLLRRWLAEKRFIYS